MNNNPDHELDNREGQAIASAVPELATLDAESPPETADRTPDSAPVESSTTFQPPGTAGAQPGPELVLVATIERAPQETVAARPTLDRIIEALLFAATSPAAESRLREIAGCSSQELSAVVAQLNHEYESDRRAFRIHRIAQGYQLYTLPEYSDWVKGLFKAQRGPRLSKAALETIAIIAYKQPATRPEIEQLRGVDCSAPLATLLDRKLIVLAGRAHKPGSPFLYRTSKEFLRYFGLASLEDLPRQEELEEFLRRRADQESEADRQEGAELSAVVG